MQFTDACAPSTTQISTNGKQCEVFSLSKFGSDTSAGSPMETLLRLLLPLND